MGVIKGDTRSLDYGSCRHASETKALSYVLTLRSVPFQLLVETTESPFFHIIAGFRSSGCRVEYGHNTIMIGTAVSRTSAALVICPCASHLQMK